jgi:hypothetical protein
MALVTKNTEVGSGCGAALCLVIFGCFVAFLSVRSCNNPYHAAERMVAKDTCAAAAQFAVVVRNDARGWSRNAVERLGELDSPCVLKELINLMDLPDGKYNSHFDREIIWAAIEERAKKLDSSVKLPPRYNPSGNQQYRTEQKAVWAEWLQSAGKT